MNKYWSLLPTTRELLNCYNRLNQTSNNYSVHFVYGRVDIYGKKSTKQILSINFTVISFQNIWETITVWNHQLYRIDTMPTLQRIVYTKSYWNETVSEYLIFLLKLKVFVTFTVIDLWQLQTFDESNNLYAVELLRLKLIEDEYC